MDLADLIAAARKDHPRVRGIGIVHQAFGVKTPFVAFCVDAYGKICDPRSWDTHPTPEAALEDLAQQFE